MARRLLLVLALALVLAPNAFAVGGNYVLDGGTHAEQAQVKAALAASSFDFGVVPGPVTIHIQPGVEPHSTPGQIWLDASLLDTGTFSWGVVQHEYGHQVDFALLDDADRAQLHALLGGSAWCSGAPHAQLDCERFADMISWAYWSSPQNVLRPTSAADEAGQVSPAAFRALLAQMLPQPVRRVAVVAPRRKAPPRKG
jgi:hypothetical protein